MRLRNPEIEFCYSGNLASNARQPFETAIDLLEVNTPCNGGVRYERSMGHDALKESLCNPAGEANDSKRQPLLRILFIQGHISASDASTSKDSCVPATGQLEAPHDSTLIYAVNPALHPRTADLLRDSLGVSPAFLDVVLHKPSLLRTGNSFKRRYEDSTGAASGSGKRFVFEGWYRFSCGFNSFSTQLWFSYTPTSTTYIMTNCKYNGVQDIIVRCCSDSEGSEGIGWSSFLQPLAIDAIIGKLTTQAWSKEIIVPRSILVNYERRTEALGAMVAEPVHSVRELHILSCTLHMIKEDMMDHVERLEYLLEVHGAMRDILLGPIHSPIQRSSAHASPSSSRTSLSTTLSAPTPPEGPASHATSDPTDSSLSFLLSETRNLRRWVQNYIDRTGIQMNLSYALAAQKDSATNLEIAHFSSRIAAETHNDSSSMITMAALTMLFLPGTFVSAIFSMVFFQTTTVEGGRALSVAPSWWLFPAATIPLTLMVFVVWHLWRRYRSGAWRMGQARTPTASNHALQANVPMGPENILRPELATAVEKSNVSFSHSLRRRKVPAAFTEHLASSPVPTGSGDRLTQPAMESLGRTMLPPTPTTGSLPHPPALETTVQYPALRLPDSVFQHPRGFEVATEIHYSIP
ncbi:hypothetical protein DFP72DRAFT_1170586 [Ephemerocybe angulata]|uniref:Uncharacterized protein n=1 Tax=Ephemerocybe angulata TaxID=980116 RepID=A0A8H6M3E9_9AGAR|nr:hypothetical protein DFP72DRAFT_1170586 [Tulosesus angulatus]